MPRAPLLHCTKPSMRKQSANLAQGLQRGRQSRSAATSRRHRLRSSSNSRSRHRRPSDREAKPRRLRARRAAQTRQKTSWSACPMHYGKHSASWRTCKRRSRARPMIRRQLEPSSGSCRSECKAGTLGFPAARKLSPLLAPCSLCPSACRLLLLSTRSCAELTFSSRADATRHGIVGPRPYPRARAADGK
jgi:hypothetical protein